MPAGQGDGHFNSLLEQLNIDNFEGFFSFEAHLTSEKDPKGGEEKFALAVNAFKNLVSKIYEKCHKKFG